LSLQWGGEKTVNMTVLDKHPEKNLIRLQLSQNVVLQHLDQESMAELERHLVISDLKK
jgi:hypothetical protein